MGFFILSILFGIAAGLFTFIVFHRELFNEMEKLREKYERLYEDNQQLSEKHDAMLHQLAVQIKSTQETHAQFLEYRELSEELRTRLKLIHMSSDMEIDVEEVDSNEEV